jgi:polysaccharide export outer membrane protein
MSTPLRRSAGFTDERRACLALAVVGLGLTIAACASSSPPAPEPTYGVEPALGLQPGDAVRLDVWREEDLSGTFRVDDRGVAIFPLLGDRHVAGREPAELRDELLADYREYLRNPSIEVTVLRRINILGAVGQPGLYTVDATMSLSEALGLAGGVTPEGDSDDIRLYRDDRVIKRNLDRSVLVSDVDMRSGDRIVVAEKNWFERNPGALIGSLIAAAAGITVALIR